MKGIIATNDPHLVEIVAKAFPEWLVVVTQTIRPIEYYPAPSK